MRRNQIVPPRTDGKDIGWRWVRGAGLLHFYRSRSQASIAVSHCGLIMDKSLLEKPIKIEECNYCKMIEGMRDA